MSHFISIMVKSTTGHVDLQILPVLNGNKTIENRRASITIKLALHNIASLAFYLFGHCELVYRAFE